MLTAEAAVETGRASRCAPQLRAQVDWSGDHGVIILPWGRCTLDAGPDMLSLRAEAPDEDSLRELQTRIADRLAQVGRRDRMTVTWSPRRPTGPGRHRHGRRRQPERTRT